MQRYGYEYKTRVQGNDRRPGRIIRFLNLLVLVFSILVFVLIALSVIKVFRENLIQKKIISPVVSGIQNIISPPSLQKIVTKSLNGQEGEYAVVIKNLKTDESYAFNQDKVFESASLYKLWVMGEAFKLIAEGKLDPDKVLTSKVADLNDKFDIATESAELTEGTVTARVQDALIQMIQISNNYSALLLVSEIKLSNVTRFLNDFGFSNSKTGSPPTTTAADIADFYEKLYSGQLGNKQSTEAMLDLLKNQTLNDRIPKYLPESLVIGHKTGELDGFKHDAGIVYTPKGNYIIVMLSKTSSEAEAAEQEALLSKAVYEYFEVK